MGGELSEFQGPAMACVVAGPVSCVPHALPMWPAYELLIALYLALPITALLFALFFARRRRSAWPIVDLSITVLSAIFLGIVVCLLFGHFTDLHVPFSQYVVASYVSVSVLLLLKGASWLLRQGFERLFRVYRDDMFFLPRNASWFFRSATALLLRMAILVAIGLPYLMAIGLIYRPRGVSSELPPYTLGEVDYEQVAFQSTDGLTLAGWWIPTRPPADASTAEPDWGKKTVVLCHGLGHTKGSQLGLVRDLSPNGYNVLAFDFRAHGESDGQLTSFGDRERFDVLGAVRWARATHAAEANRIVGLGIGTGGAALLAAAADDSDLGRQLDAVAVIGVFDRFDRFAGDITDTYTSVSVGWLIRNVGLPIASWHAGADLATFAPVDMVDRIAPRPLLVIQARADPLVAFAAGANLYERASTAQGALLGRAARSE